MRRRFGSPNARARAVSEADRWASARATNCASGRESARASGGASARADSVPGPGPGPTARPGACSAAIVGTRAIGPSPKAGRPSGRRVSCATRTGRPERRSRPSKCTLPCRADDFDPPGRHQRTPHHAGNVGQEAIRATIRTDADQTRKPLVSRSAPSAEYRPSHAPAGPCTRARRVQAQEGKGSR